MSHLFTVDNLVSFLVLTLLEVVLGIDNVIFVSIIINRMPKAFEKRARLLWMIMGITTRTILLFGLSWLLAQKGKSVFTVMDKSFDLASLVMLGGGLFLLYKTVREIHHKLEGEAEHYGGQAKQLGFTAGIVQIMLIDMVFSFDSIITAGGTAKHLEIMVAAVVIAMLVMFMFSPAISAFIHKHPAFKMLALSFLVMIGFVLLVEGWDAERSHELHLKNYVYFAMAFSFGVEILNMKTRKAHQKPVALRHPSLPEAEAAGKSDMAR
ncbi:MAG: TerC family protein [Sphingobacteriia bacterium]|nr:MAG: TerC family protein [Sphingobacteriia bacterium]